MGSDLDKVEKLFCGKWKYDRDDNFKESLKYIGFPEMEVEFLTNAKPCLEIKRDGDHLIIDYEIMPGMVHSVRFKLGEEFVSKDMKNDPPTFDAKELVTFKDGCLDFKNWSNMGGAYYQTVMKIENGELHGVMSKIDDNSVTGDRIYKKV
ncbi:fatty acid-binding protein homolog 7-like [Ruditapes philippinarum]|uniref:fatty acid-binding protein homolog 7-like n=1 Tax=Ruditapes philippinarum TaxID=129788 RepID=UPI00295BDBB0|nr:fatty acid-binding protein homolog 7-like [Ruditapes philippinarum]